MITVPPGVVDGPTARRLSQEGAVFVDVRTPAEFAAGHVPGARNIPFDEIGLRAAEIGPPSTPVVVYCKSGKRAAVARATLAGLGYRDLWDMQSYEAWGREAQ